MKEFPQPGQNTGLILKPQPPSQWKLGETGILDIPINPSGDWQAYLPTPERQGITTVDGATIFDTYGCVSFSACNALETQMNYMIAHNLVPAGSLQWLKDNGYIDANNKVNFSDRFVAKLANTSPKGNDIFTIWDTIRNKGLIPEADFPYPVEALKAAAPANRWNIYYQNPTSAMLAKAQEFRKHFNIQYDLVVYPGEPGTNETFREMLKFTPLQSTTAVCDGWFTSQVIAACGAGTGHATMMSNVIVGLYYNIFDTYIPFEKKFAHNYSITYAMRGVISPTIIQTVFPAPNPFKHFFTQQLDFGQTTSEVTPVQDALKLEGIFPLTVQSSMYFGSITRDAVQKFQVKYGITGPGVGGYGRVGPKTLAKLNALYNI